MAGTQAVYYRDARGAEPVDEFIQALPAKHAANTRYRIHYQRSENLVVLLHALEKDTDGVRS